jgi:hypothetical protein
MWLFTRLGSFQLPLIYINALADQHFSLYEIIKKNSFIIALWQNGKIFTGIVFISCPKDGENV